MLTTPPCKTFVFRNLRELVIESGRMRWAGHVARMGEERVMYRVPREYSVAAILLLLFMMLISLFPLFNLLYFYFSTLLSMCAVPNVAVFCSSLTSRFPCMLLTYFLK